MDLKAIAERYEDMAQQAEKAGDVEEFWRCIRSALSAREMHAESQKPRAKEAPSHD